jgi:hypothetical protein
MPTWLAATLPSQSPMTDCLIERTQSDRYKPSDTATPLELSRESKRRRLSHGSSRPRSPSPPAYSFVSFAAPSKPNPDEEDTDPDAAWSTLPGKTKKKDNDKKNRPIRRSGPFCLPGLSTTSKTGTGASLSAEEDGKYRNATKPVLPENVPVKKTRVITYLPPPRPSSSSTVKGAHLRTQHEVQLESDIAASSDDRQLDISNNGLAVRSRTQAPIGLKSRLEHRMHEPLPSESIRGSSPSPLPVDVDVQIDEYSIRERYPYTMKFMRKVRLYCVCLFFCSFTGGISVLLLSTLNMAVASRSL